MWYAADPTSIRDLVRMAHPTVGIRDSVYAAHHTSAVGCAVRTVWLLCTKSVLYSNENSNKYLIFNVLRENQGVAAAVLVVDGF
jgi:hypothetical protein